MSQMVETRIDFERSVGMTRDPVVVEIGPDQGRDYLNSQWHEYELARDPYRAAGLAAVRSQVLEIARRILALSPEIARQAARHIFFSALESYVQCDLTPVDDMVGGWSATAEVESNQPFAQMLKQELRAARGIGSPCAADTDHPVSSIKYTIRETGSADTARINLPASPGP